MTNLSWQFSLQELCWSCKDSLQCFYSDLCIPLPHPRPLLIRTLASGILRWPVESLHQTGNKGHGERDFERARSAKRARGGGKNYYKSQISRRDMENSLFQQPLGLESRNAPRTSLFRQWLCAREELYPLLLKAVSTDFLKIFKIRSP